MEENDVDINDRLSKIAIEHILHEHNKAIVERIQRAAGIYSNIAGHAGEDEEEYKEGNDDIKKKDIPDTWDFEGDSLNDIMSRLK